jgi:hypothetical protein
MRYSPKEKLGAAAAIVNALAAWKYNTKPRFKTIYYIT